MNLKSDKIKRIIRNFKKVEIRMMVGIYGINSESYSLIWNQYFELNKPYKGHSKYNLDTLINMDSVEFEKVVNEYFNSILNRFYKVEDATKVKTISNTLGLSPNANAEEVKKRFRELAKKMHPDVGGTDEEFIALYEAYQEFIKNIK